MDVTCSECFTDVTLVYGLAVITGLRGYVQYTI